MNDELVDEYVELIKPLLPLAQKAYGAKNQETAAHQASREYTRLLTEFHSKNGSLLRLAKALGVSYSGLRRRVFTDGISIEPRNSSRKPNEEQIAAAIERVKKAKASGPKYYHQQLAVEYMVNGVSLGTIARALGISNASPLYYGVQRHLSRKR